MKKQKRRVTKCPRTDTKIHESSGLGRPMFIRSYPRLSYRKENKLVFLSVHIVQ